MEKFEIIIIAVTLMTIIAGVFILLFVGVGNVFSGKPAPYGASPPPDDATLWEKDQWEKFHGSVFQCGWFAETEGPVVMYPATASSIANISFGFALVPGEQPHEISTISYTLSTRTAMKTVRYGDPAVSISLSEWNKTPSLLPGDLRNTRVEDNELVTVELDTRKMGFGDSELGPGEKFIINIVPEDDCIRDIVIRDQTPLFFLPGSRIELSREGKLYP